MKIDVTTACSMGCTHCASDCKTKGVHGKVSDLTDAMDFCKAWDKSGFVLLSGGEPFEHPQAATLVEEALTRFNVVAVATNGDRLSTDPGVYKAVRELKRRAGRRLAIQVTNDPLYYPKRLTPRQEYNLSKLGVKVIERVPVVNGQSLYPQGRALVNHADANWLTTAPKCVNLRLIARQGVTDLGELLTTMSARLGKFCTPTLGPGREVRLGESALCPPVATIDDAPEEVVRKVRDCECKACAEAVKRAAQANPLAARIMGWDN